MNKILYYFKGLAKIILCLFLVFPIFWIMCFGALFDIIRQCGSETYMGKHYLHSARFFSKIMDL